MPRATNGPCSPSVNGKPRSRSWRRPESRSGLRAGLLEDADRGRSDERRRGRTRRVAGDQQPRPARARERIEADHGQRVLAVGRALGEVGCAERAERAAVGRDEDERVRRLRLHERRAADRRERARELDQGTRAGGVVVRTAAFAGVVAVRGDHDRALRGAADDGDEVLQLDLAASRDLRREAVHPRFEAVELELVGDPGGGAEAAGGAGRAVRVLAGQLAGELLGDRDVEGRRQRRRRQRLRARDAEGGQAARAARRGARFPARAARSRAARPSRGVGARASRALVWAAPLHRPV